MHVVILGKSNCPYCVKAKELVETTGLNYKYIDIVAKGYTKKDLEVYTGCKVETVPQIFVDGKHIGGYTEFEDYLTFMVYN
jgi:glutaredoxin 1